MNKMKRKCRALLAAALTISAYTSISAQASEILNIPSSAAIERHNTAQDHCGISLGYGIYADLPAPAACYVDFPLTIPAGHTIDQILVFHESSGSINPFIDAFLSTQAVAVPYNNQWLFDWQTTQPVPNGTIATTPLMTQNGRFYPEAFLVRTDTVYHVIVHLTNGASVEGLQVIYE